MRKSVKNIWKLLLNCITFASLLARIAQLVEHDLAKVGVASSSLVSRSFFLRSFEVENQCPGGGIGRRAGLKIQ